MRLSGNTCLRFPVCCVGCLEIVGLSKFCNGWSWLPPIRQRKKNHWLGLGWCAKATKQALDTLFRDLLQAGVISVTIIHPSFTKTTIDNLQWLRLHGFEAKGHISPVEWDSNSPASIPFYVPRCAEITGWKMQQKCTRALDDKCHWHLGPPLWYKTMH